MHILLNNTESYGTTSNNKHYKLTFSVICKLIPCERRADEAEVGNLLVVSKCLNKVDQSLSENHNEIKRKSSGEEKIMTQDATYRFSCLIDQHHYHPPANPMTLM